ncbi:MAG: hypothetical protein ABI165_04710 [Bryobacteraceae bacterium]
MSQEIVADRASSQHLEGMNHLAALQRVNRGSESCIIPDVAAVSDDRRQSVLESPTGSWYTNKLRMHQARLETESTPAAFCLSQDKLF